MLIKIDFTEEELRWIYLGLMSLSKHFAIPLGKLTYTTFRELIESEKIIEGIKEKIGIVSGVYSEKHLLQ